MSAGTILFIIGTVVAAVLLLWWSYGRVARARRKRPKRGDNRRY